MYIYFSLNLRYSNRSACYMMLTPSLYSTELCPECAAYYSNRSACYMMLGKYAEALADAREATRRDATFVKVQRGTDG